MTPKLNVITASTRPGRKGPAVARWFLGRALAHGKFDVEPVDLAEVGLPLFDEPIHPNKRQYVHEHTRRWSRIVDAADAYVFVTPEYNYGTAPSLLNALDFVYHEWSYKPAAFVSYGGFSGGIRGAQMARLALTTFKVMPLPEAVAFPFFAKHLTEAGEFEPGDSQDKPAEHMLNELYRWTVALRPMREVR